MDRQLSSRRFSLVRRLRWLALILVAFTVIGAETRPAQPAMSLSSAQTDIVSWAWNQVGHGYTGCHYGLCNGPWCAAFATTGWRHAGEPIPWYDSVSQIHTWAVNHGRWRGGYGAYHHPGDMVLYRNSSGDWVHVGIIVNGTGYGGDIRTIEGNYSSKVSVVGYFPVSNPGGWEPGFHIAGYVAT